MADLVVIGYPDEATADKALAALAPFGGEVIKTSRSEDATAEINAALAADRATAGAPAGGPR